MLPLPPTQNAPEQAFSGLQLTYQDAPTFTAVSPASAPADVDSTLTITGAGFTFAASRLSISVGSLPCLNPVVISTSALTCQVRATTRRFTGPVSVTGYVESVGNVLSSASFSFLHYWSRPATWGTQGVPADRADVVVPSDMTIVLDGATASLGSLVLEGNLVFDPATPVVELTAGSVLLKGAQRRHRSCMHHLRWMHAKELRCAA